MIRHTPMSDEEAKRAAGFYNWGPQFDEGGKVPWVCRAAPAALERDVEREMVAFRIEFKKWAKEHWPEALRA